MMRQCKTICKSNGKRCSRRQRKDYCYQHRSPTRPSPVSPSRVKLQYSAIEIPFDFSDAPRASKLKAFREALKQVSWKQYTMHWQTGSTKVLVKPIRGLTPCAHPQRNVFDPKNMEKQYKHAYSMLSKTKNSRLVIPVRPYSHLRCFVHKASWEEFSSLMTLTQHFVRKSPRPVRVFTEGLEVGWLHVKIR
jgi:hypothetical protein